MENILKNKFHENDDVTIIMWFPWPSLFEHKTKTAAGDCLSFKFLRGQKTVDIFSEVSEFLLRSVDGVRNILLGRAAHRKLYSYLGKQK